MAGINSLNQYQSYLEGHPSFPALDLGRVQTGTLGGNLEGQYHKLSDITTLDPKYTNPENLTSRDLQKLMHETTHRAMNVDPGVVQALGVSARNIPYSGKYKKSTGFVPSGGGWEWNPKDFGFDEGPTLRPSDPSEIFTRRVDVDAWDGTGIGKEGEFMTDIEVADAVKANKSFHDPILDRKTGVHWQTRGAGAAPGESLRARTGIRSVFDPYVDKFKEAMTKYKGGENYFADYLDAKKQGISLRDYLANVNEELELEGLENPFDNYLGINQNLGVNQKRFKQQQLMNRRKQDMQRQIREAVDINQRRIQEEEKKRIEQEKIKTAQDNWKPTYNPASSHAEARSTGGDYHSGHQSTVGGQTTDWGSESAMIARGGLAQHAPRYANGGLIDFYRYGGFI
jgi:hypothetical protein